jgi:hypothetical protein
MILGRWQQLRPTCPCEVVSGKESPDERATQSGCSSRALWRSRWRALPSCNDLTERRRNSPVTASFHSGGSSLTYVPSALMRRPQTPAALAQDIEMLRTFGAPVIPIASVLRAPVIARPQSRYRHSTERARGRFLSFNLSEAGSPGACRDGQVVLYLTGTTFEQGA